MRNGIVCAKLYNQFVVIFILKRGLVLEAYKYDKG